ncbi:oxidoreductase [Mycolicibacterium helvum]|uniref:Oxidoreductase n=2 Tax=Mycolicibacterium helvum TaxID=1534349 RepID=A0A7I7T8D4_9MYCO|nr:oxidoreductase [Mycolicibacterium helvum]
MRWGLMSTARIAADVIPGLQSSSKNELVAVGSRNADSAARFADEHGIDRAHGSYEELLGDDGVDCVYIPVPNHLHGHWTRQALLAGKHVLCEKPFVVDAAEAEELFALADAKSLHLAEAFMYRHHPKTHALKRLVSDGEIGEIHTVRAWFTYSAEDVGTDIRFHPDMAGGALRDVGSYPVSMSNYLLDAEPASVHATAVRSAQGVDERFYAQLLYAGGAVATVDCSMRSHSGYGVTVVGSTGSASVKCPWYSHKSPHCVELIREDGAEESIAVGSDNAYFLETESFADVVRGLREAEISAAETIRTARTLTRLAEAAART